MTTQTLTPANEAFVELSAHCVACPDCRPNPDQPEAAQCPEAARLYRTWFGHWRKDAAS